MPHTRRRAVRLASLLALATVTLSCGGGGDGGGTAPPTVASVEIGAAATPVLFQTIGRTTQLTAVARDAAGAAIAGASVTWNSSSATVASVSTNGGVVTAVGNGTAQVTASAGGVASPSRTITVAQVPASIAVTPATVAFGAIGSSRQLAGAVVDSSGAPVAGAPALSWTRAGTGAVASVSPTGLATALAVGASDTAVASASGFVARVPISVTQVVASILVNSTGPDTLATTGRTKQYAAVPRDSQGNAIPGVIPSWTSSLGSVASIGSGSGLATALGDGITNVIATSNAVTGQRALTVRRFAAVLLASPASVSITTPAGTQSLSGTAQDSVATDLPITWVSRATTVATVAPSSGAAVTAQATGNGSTHVVMTAGTRRDSVLVTVSGQPSFPLLADVTVGDFFFRSVNNGSQNAAVDTIGVGGTVVWSWAGAASHNVQSTGAPSFTSSSVRTSGTYQFTFSAAGSYDYICIVHGISMSGRVVVR
jgi:hypothetical protein